jgi:hypothetical protein
MLLIAIGFISFFYMIVFMIEKKKQRKRNVEKIPVINSVSSIERNHPPDFKKNNIKLNQEESSRTSLQKTNHSPKRPELFKRNNNDTVSIHNDPNSESLHDHGVSKVKNKSEEECRVIIESIFKRKFPTTRPDFLKNPLSKKNLELDCYCEELGIALEYNGIQHYKYPNPFHKTEYEFKKQLERDIYKKKMCRINDVLLIVIPYDMKKEKIRRYIIDCYNNNLK